jgi:hypothetical protein
MKSFVSLFRNIATRCPNQYARWRKLSKQHKWNERMRAEGEEPAEEFLRQTSPGGVVNDPERAPRSEGIQCIRSMLSRVSHRISAQQSSISAITMSAINRNDMKLAQSGRSVV